jgi:hypothetical protein
MDLMKQHLICDQRTSPTAPINGAANVTVAGVFSGGSPTLEIRRSLWGLFADGTERLIARHVYPHDPPTVVHTDTAVRVWTTIDPSEPVSFGEVLTLS